ncbi:MAG: nitroreductase family protein [Erysipelotrichaceae bacterium]
MEFINLAKERFSHRAFSEQPVEKEKLDLILEAGRIAPTAGNYQPQRILVIQSDEAIAKLKLCTPCHYNATLILLVCYEDISKNPFTGEKIGEIDASIVTTHMMLEATELGLGTVWVGYFNPALIRTHFHLPENYIPVCLLPIGYPDDDAYPSPMHESRKPLEKTVFYNDFNFED